MIQMIIDSGAILATVDKKDKYHIQAKDFLRKQPENTQFLIPELIFVETLTLVKSRLGAKIAIDVGNRLQKSARFQIIEIEEITRILTWEIFEQYVDKAWSYPDCAIMALARQLGISFVFSFDHHISQMAEVQKVP